MWAGGSGGKSGKVCTKNPMIIILTTRSGHGQPHSASVLNSIPGCTEKEFGAFHVVHVGLEQFRVSVVQLGVFLQPPINRFTHTI